MTPFVSVVMPVRNEARSSRAALERSWRRTTRPTVLEVLVADGMSTTTPRTIVHERRGAATSARATDRQSRGASSPPAEPGAARGARRDHRAGRRPLRDRARLRAALRGASRRTGRSSASADRSRRSGRRRWRAAIAAAMSSTVRRRRLGVSHRDGPLDARRHRRLPRLSRERFSMRVGDFDEELVRNQDDEYNYRLRKMGARILLAARCPRPLLQPQLAANALATVSPIRVLEGARACRSIRDRCSRGSSSRRSSSRRC